MWIKDVRDYIIYEDKEILVCHKPAGIAVQSAGVGNMDLESLLKNYIARKQPGKMPYLGVIHRLDQPVEGVVVFALNPKAAAALNRQMTSGQIRKTYLAVTAGDLPGKEGKLEDWLKKDGRTNTSRAVKEGTEGAKKAVLYWKLLETKETVDEMRSLLEIRLETGRHHQIRVQMANAGMPLVGDRKYNPEKTGREPLCLCSAALEIRHPLTGKKMQLQVRPAGEGFQAFDMEGYVDKK